MKLEVCGGCNAKIGAGDLDNILKSLEIYKRDDIIVGFDTSDDAAIIKISDEESIVFTLDFFPTMVEDPYAFGQIAAANAMSDVYAMGGEVVSCLNIVAFPEGEDLNILKEILRGGADKVKEAKATLTGGHSIHDNKIKYGLSVVGKLKNDSYWRNDSCELDEYIVLTKPLGISLLSSGYSVGEVSEKDFNNAIKYMTLLNKYPRDIMVNHKVGAVTDVTGFGLIGHLIEMLKDNYSAEIYSDNLPILEGAYNAAQAFLFTAGAQRNRGYYANKVDFKIKDFGIEEIMFDPQTSGGLLFSAKKDEMEKILEEFKEKQIEAWVIGKIINKKEKTIIVRENENY